MQVSNLGIQITLVHVIQVSGFSTAAATPRRTTKSTLMRQEEEHDQATTQHILASLECLGSRPLCELLRTNNSSLPLLKRTWVPCKHMSHLSSEKRRWIRVVRCETLDLVHQDVACLYRRNKRSCSCLEPSLSVGRK